jgi:hypothetical protein
MIGQDQLSAPYLFAPLRLRVFALKSTTLTCNFGRNFGLSRKTGLGRVPLVRP